jgi:hypothetical protein
MLKFKHLLVSVLLLANVQIFAHATEDHLALRGLISSVPVEQVTAWNFDWDDNIFFMPTKIVLFHKETGEELEISTSEFAVHKNDFGKTGRFENYEVRYDPKTGSYRYFRDHADVNYFFNHIKETIESKPATEWQGPAWDAFVKALSRADTAEWTTIITTRGHSPETITEGLKYLKSKGYIKHLPPLDNIYGVSSPKYQHLGANPAEVKVVLLNQILDKLERYGEHEHMVEVITPDGTGRQRMHLFGFSDDDHNYFTKAVDSFVAAVKTKSRPLVKTVVFFTGTHTPDVAPHGVTILPDGTTRKLLPGEHKEFELVSTIQSCRRLLNP